MLAACTFKKDVGFVIVKHIHCMAVTNKILFVNNIYKPLVDGCSHDGCTNHL